jgi:ribulose-5-phosphate 4-epimerase/fuculose-1-phosphate aldolase
MSGGSVDEGRLRDAIVAAGRRLGARGLIAASEGNLSIRLPDHRLLVTPSGRRKDELEPADLVVVGLRGDAGADDGARPSSDLAIHRAVLLARPDATSVAHAHLPATMALTLAGLAPDATALPETALFLPRLEVLPFGEPGSAELATRIAAALTAAPEPYPNAVILERHGAVAVGGGDDPVAALGQAVDRLELIEVLSRAWRDAILLRGASGPG